MANVSITAGNVVKSTGSVIETGIAGEAITAGQTVYKKAADSQYYLADVDAEAVGDSAEIDNVYGIALNGGSADQPLTVQKSGTITIGGTVVVGTVYVVSATAGGIAPWADLVSTDYVSIVGVATTAGTIAMSLNIAGVAIPS